MKGDRITFAVTFLAISLTIVFSSGINAFAGSNLECLNNGALTGDCPNNYSASIQGLKYEDINGNGEHDFREPYLNGWTMFLDENYNHVLDAGEQSTITAYDESLGDGVFWFKNLPLGDYVVCEVMQDNWAQTDPGNPQTPECIESTLTYNGQICDGHDFGNEKLGKITGKKYNDSNLNGQHDEQEPYLNGWTIFLDTNMNGVLDAGEQSTVTEDKDIDQPGFYSFMGLFEDNYHVCEVLQKNWIQTQPGSTQNPKCYDVTVDSSSQKFTGLNFGNFECPTGEQLVGDTCTPIECPTGEQLVGDTCTPIECPTGEQLVGDTCTPIESEIGKGGGDEQWDTRPTFGISHETRETMVVDNGFVFNDNSFTLTDNHHTPFDEQVLEIGTLNTFTAKVYASKDLKIQEFLFGVPEVGMGHLAEIRVEVWYDTDGKIDDVKVIQETEVIDRASLSVTHKKSKCLETDTEENCDTTTLSAVFLESLADKVMAIKAIDFALRGQTTFLNEGFVLSGDSLNPMTSKMIPSSVKGEGLVQVTQNEKYSDYWTTQDGRIFEMNSFGSFKQINPSFVRFQDSGEPLTRLHSEFGKIVDSEKQRASQIFDATALLAELQDSFGHQIVIADRLDDNMKQKILLQEEIAQELFDKWYRIKTNQ